MQTTERGRDQQVRIAVAGQFTVALAASMKLGPSLHRIGNDIVAAYLVHTDEGVTVIDAGLAGH